MEKIEKTLRYTKLFNLYNAFLSDSQREIFTDYFLADLSISEISENRNISRAAVEDSLSKSLKKLDLYEDSLKVCSTRENIRQKCLELKKTTANSEQNKIIDEILEEIK